MIFSCYFNHLYGIQCINEYFNKTAPIFSIGAVKFLLLFSSFLELLQNAFVVFESDILIQGGKAPVIV